MFQRVPVLVLYNYNTFRGNSYNYDCQFHVSAEHKFDSISWLTDELELLWQIPSIVHYPLETFDASELKIRHELPETLNT